MIFFLVSGLPTYSLAQFVLESLMLLQLLRGWEVSQAVLSQELSQHCAKIDTRLVAWLTISRSGEWSHKCLQGGWQLTQPHVMAQMIIWMAHSGDFAVWSSCICMNVLFDLLYVFIWKLFRIKFTVTAPQWTNPTHPAPRGAGSLRVNHAKQFLLVPNILSAALLCEADTRSGRTAVLAQRTQADHSERRDKTSSQSRLLKKWEEEKLCFWELPSGQPLNFL